VKEKLKTRFVHCVALAVSTYLLAPAALAQQSTATAAVDASNVVDKIINQIAAIAMIGGGVLLLIVTVKVFWWLRFVLAFGAVVKAARKE